MKEKENVVEKYKIMLLHFVVQIAFITQSLDQYNTK